VDDATKRRLEKRRITRTVPLRRRARQPDHGRGLTRADQVARDPTRVEGRLDLRGRVVEAAGHRCRRSRPEAVPLPPELSRTARAGEVRQADPVRRRAPRPARGDGRAHGQRPARPRPRLGDRNAPDQQGLVSGRHRALREGVEDVRDHDAPQKPCDRARPPDRVSLPWEAPVRDPHDSRRLGARGVGKGAARATPWCASLPLGCARSPERS